MKDGLSRKIWNFICKVLNDSYFLILNNPSIVFSRTKMGFILKWRLETGNSRRKFYLILFFNQIASFLMPLPILATNNALYRVLESQPPTYISPSQMCNNAHVFQYLRCGFLGKKLVINTLSCFVLLAYFLWIIW